MTPGLRRFLAFAAGLCVLVATARAQSSVTLTIHEPATTRAIPADFVGLSFEISNLLPDKNGRYMFSAENRSLINLFRGVGIKSLRVGGGTAEPKSGNAVEDAKFPVPGPKDIDQLFAFAEAADLKIIYTLRLLNGDKNSAAAIARHIADHYKARLDSFSIGNEPDWHAYHSYPGRTLDSQIFETSAGVPGSAYPSFLARWNEFAAAIVKAVPDAKFSGPDTGSNYPVTGAKDTDYNGKSWTENFADNQKGATNITAILTHDYVGQSADGVSVPAAVDAMLSRKWLDSHYPALFDHVLARVQADGFAYRMTECNDHTGGVDGASNAFVSALWALDYLHWHAAHGAIGLNFHNKRWIYTCTITLDSTGQFKINPKAYGLKTFALGSHGRVAPITITNPDEINVTAYAVVDDATSYITIINKEHGTAARTALVTIVAPSAAREASAMFLRAPNSDPTARVGITLGGAAMSNDGIWAGAWKPISIDAAGRCTVNVEATSAVVVKCVAR